MISTFTVVIDANVFFGNRLRSLFLTLAKTKMFRARWTEDIHREWMTAVVEKRPDLVDAVQFTREQMDKAVLDCLVTGYAGLIDTLKLPDPDDRHVLAAAIVARANAIVTFNKRDFPPDIAASYGILITHPDDFLLDQESLDTSLFLSAVAEDLTQYGKPPGDLPAYLQALQNAGVPRTADRIAAYRVMLG